MKALNTIQEIKNAIEQGKTVYSETAYYQVIKDKKGQFLIKANNGYCIGLTNHQETELNGKNFFTT